MTVIQTAPDQLGIVQAFINTNDLLNQQDELTNPKELQHWLHQQGLIEPQSHCSKKTWQQALSFREALRALLLANNGSALDVQSIAALNQFSAAAHLQVHFNIDGSASLQPASAASQTVEAGLGQMIAIVFRAMLDGTWIRLKACRNPDCRYIFYDYSKNRAGTWCTMAICGNRIKTRAYRQRRHSVDSSPR